ncbi:MAG TPA: hypothetical protein VLV17_03725 [Anaeromyxobacteraceae bacterium]|nr:hypothetical protein [Anaeromyxobacteraceae bacterium]
MARWAGYGAGPAGAGAAGGPSRAFLTVGLLGSALAAAFLLRDHEYFPGAVAALAVVYFGLRLFAGLGRRNSP